MLSGFCLPISGTEFLAKTLHANQLILLHQDYIDRLACTSHLKYYAKKCILLFSSSSCSRKTLRICRAMTDRVEKAPPSEFASAIRFHRQNELPDLSLHQPINDNPTCLFFKFLHNNAIIITMKFCRIPLFFKRQRTGFSLF